MALALNIDLDKHYTYADYLTWPDEFHCELIDGKIYMMPPAPLLTHQDVAGEIFRQAANALLGKSCRAFIAPLDIRLPNPNQADDETADTVVQPDVLVVCDVNKLDRRGVRGAPDWVVEVLSPSTASRDQIQKRALYERHGIREYWLVHPLDHVLTIYKLIDNSYGKPEISELKGQTPVAAVPGLSIDWDQLAPYLPNDA